MQQCLYQDPIERLLVQFLVPDKKLFLAVLPSQLLLGNKLRLVLYYFLYWMSCYKEYIIQKVSFWHLVYQFSTPLLLQQLN